MRMAMSRLHAGGGFLCIDVQWFLDLLIPLTSDFFFMSPMSFFSEAMESLTEESSEREFVAQIFLSDFKSFLRKTFFFCGHPQSIISFQFLYTCSKTKNLTIEEI